MPAVSQQLAADRFADFRPELFHALEFAAERGAAYARVGRTFAILQHPVFDTCAFTVEELELITWASELGRREGIEVPQ